MSDTSNDTASPVRPAPATVPVWDAPLRIFHWALAVAVLTAWFSANVFDTLHEIAGYGVLGLIALRLLWGFIGPPYARFANFVRPPRATLRYLGSLMRGQPRRYLGHNPAGAAMTVALLATLAVSAISGWMQITQAFFGVEWVEQVHTYSSHLALILAAVHVLGVLLMCALQKENLVRAMFSGKKTARRDDP